MTERKVDRRTRRTYCRICEAACGLLAEMDETGRLQRLRPDRDHPISQGFVCAKGLRFLETANHPDRLLEPRRRQPDGSFRPVSWDEALGMFGRKIRPILAQHGPHAVGIYFGTPTIHNVMGIVSVFQLARALGTRNLFSAGSQDNNNKLATSEVMHGSAMLHPIVDLENAELAILLGTNPLVSQSSFVHLRGGSTAYDRLLERGGRIILVDPVRTASVKRWAQGPEDHLALRPGSDIYLLLALLHLLRDNYRPDPTISGLDRLLALAADYPPERAAALTGLPAAQIHNLAQAITSTPRTTFLLSVGVNQGQFGTLCYAAIQAIAYLNGSLDQAGGLLFQPVNKLLDYLLSTGIGPTESRIGRIPSAADTISCGVLADEILTPGREQIRALIVLCGNPLTSIPGEEKLRRAFKSLEMLVSIDLFANETAQLAHLQLPATSWLERWDLAAWQLLMQHGPRVQYAAPLRPAPGQARTEAQILADLSRQTGRPLFKSRLLSRLWGAPQINRWLPRLLDALLWPSRLFGLPPRLLPWFGPRPGRYLGRGPKTPDGKVHFWDKSWDGEPHRLANHAARLEQMNGDGSQFLLLGRRRRLGQNSWLHNAAPDGQADNSAWLAPADMERLGLRKGSRVVISSEAGQLLLPARGRAGVPTGLIVVPHGLPGQNINRLHPNSTATIEPVSGMLQLQGLPVCVRAGKER